MSELIEAIVSVLQDEPWVVSDGRSHVNEVHGDEECGQGEEPKSALPPNSFQRMNVVFGNKTLLVNHLRGNNHLKEGPIQSLQVNTL